MMFITTLETNATHVRNWFLSLILVSSCTLLMSHISPVSAQTVRNTVDGTDLTGYPAFESIPPANTTLTSFLLANVNIPGAPRATGLPPDYGDAIQSCGTNANVWSVTYDDGPGQYQTALLDDVAAKKIPLGFFSLGSSVMRFSASTKRMSDENHEVLMHSWSHHHMTSLTNDQIVAEIYWNAKVIYDVTGKVPRYFRPPYGDIDARVNAILKAMDIVPIIWNRDTNDYLMNTNARTEAQLLADVDTWVAAPNPNGILSLHHDRFQRPVQVAPQLHQKILSSRYRPVSVEQCINSTNRGPAYATSGKFYEAVTGYKSSTDNPNKPTASVSPTPRPTGTNNGGNSNSNSAESVIITLTSFLSLIASAFTFF